MLWDFDMRRSRSWHRSGRKIMRENAELCCLTCLPALQGPPALLPRVTSGASMYTQWGKLQMASLDRPRTLHLGQPGCCILRTCRFPPPRLRAGERKKWTFPIISRSCVHVVCVRKRGSLFVWCPITAGIGSSKPPPHWLQAGVEIEWSHCHFNHDELFSLALFSERSILVGKFIF